MANLVAVLGRAPDAWNDLPDPDSIFVGGSGREIGRWSSWPTSGCGPAAGWWPTSAASKACRPCTTRCSALAKDVKVWMINIARGTYQLERVRFEAMNPTFLLAVVKPRQS